MRAAAKAVLPCLYTNKKNINTRPIAGVGWPNAAAVGVWCWRGRQYGYCSTWPPWSSETFRPRPGHWRGSETFRPRPGHWRGSELVCGPRPDHTCMAKADFCGLAEEGLCRPLHTQGRSWGYTPKLHSHQQGPQRPARRRLPPEHLGLCDGCWGPLTP